MVQFEFIKNCSIQRYNKLPLHTINTLLDKHINSKALFTYIFLASVAEQIDDNEFVYIPDINPHKLYLLMRENNISTSCKQVINSLNELQKNGLIYINSNAQCIELIDAYISFKKKVKTQPFVKIPEILLTDFFYKLCVRGKRAFLYLFANVINTKNPKLNILKDSCYKELCRILRVNRLQKIKDALESIQDLIASKVIDMRKNIETHHFEGTEKLKVQIDSKKQMHSTEHNKKVLSKVVHFFNQNGYQWSQEEVRDIVSATARWKKNKLEKGLNIYLEEKLKKGVNHIIPYFRKLSYSLYFQAY